MPDFKLHTFATAPADLDLRVRAAGGGGGGEVRRRDLDAARPGIDAGGAWTPSARPAATARSSSRRCSRGRRTTSTALETARKWKGAQPEEHYTEDWHKPREMYEHGEEQMSDEEFKENAIIASDPKEHVERIRELEELGASVIVLQNNSGADALKAIEVYGREVLPALRGVRRRPVRLAASGGGARPELLQQPLGLARRLDLAELGPQAVLQPGVLADGAGEVALLGELAHPRPRGRLVDHSSSSAAALSCSTARATSGGSSSRSSSVRHAAGSNIGIVGPEQNWLRSRRGISRLTSSGR